MKVLILGGTGAMGSPLVQILAKRDCQVYVTSRKIHVSEKTNIHYLTGDALNPQFIQDCLKNNKYDAIVDFLIYDLKKFEEYVVRLLNNTKQYFFLSSSRVYSDNNDDLITETTPRLLNVIQDKVYIDTDEYALTKAREEDFLLNSKFSNWTIIRPYITYNNNRLQLGTFEKEIWLRRALEGKPIIFGKDMASKYTTLTHGYDVALRIADLIGNSKALGEIFNITSHNFIKWKEVLDIYLDVIEEYTGKKPEVYWQDNSEFVIKACNNKYQVNYDRLYNRKFDNSKIIKFTGNSNFIDVKEGLKTSLRNFLFSDQIYVGKRDYRPYGVLDRIIKDSTPLKYFNNFKSKVKYGLYRSGIF